jgi:type IV secretion system protein VirB11
MRAAGDFVGLLKTAVQARRTIPVSGGTSTGKTTFLSTLMREINAAERLIPIEDTAELELHHDNAIGLIASRSAPGEAVVDMDALLSAAAAPMREMEWRSILPFTNQQAMID